MRFARFCVALLTAALLLTAVSFAAKAPATNSAPKSPTLEDQLKSDDAAQLQQTLDSIRDRLLATAKPEPTLVKSFIAAGKHEQFDALAWQIISTQPSRTELIADLQRMRAEVLLAAGKTAEALTAAKAYYNVAPAKDTESSIKLLSLCLAAARPADTTIVRRFKEEQIEGAKLPLPSTQPATAPASVLSSIKIDAAPCEQAIAALKITSYEGIVGRGNLLLLADRPGDARECFEQAYELADQNQLVAATENIVRAIRAQYGCIGPANDYILKLRDGNMPPKTAGAESPGPAPKP